MTIHRLERIAAAPISFGVFGNIQLDLSTATLLSIIADTGHCATELGPPGFMGPADLLQDKLDSANLAVVGAYIPLHLSGERSLFDRDLVSFRHSLTELRVCTEHNEKMAFPAPLAILADEGSPELNRKPFRDSEPALNPGEWQLALERLNEARLIARESNIPVCFHPHFGTYVENAKEIDRLLETSDIALCLDTGHFLLGGAYPEHYLESCSDRVDLIHLKDIAVSVYLDAREKGLSADQGWWDNLSVPFGKGDINLEAFLSKLDLIDYDGWIVIEQDRAAVMPDTLESAVEDQRHNVNWLNRFFSQSS